MTARVAAILFIVLVVGISVPLLPRHGAAVAQQAFQLQGGFPAKTIREGRQSDVTVVGARLQPVEIPLEHKTIEGVRDLLGLGTDRWIRLQARTFSPEPGIEQDDGNDPGVESYISDTLARGLGSQCEQAAAEDCVHLLVQYEDLLNRTIKDRLRDNGRIYVLDPIPETAYFIGVTPGPRGDDLTAADILKWSGAEWLGVIRPEYKIAPSLCAFARSPAQIRRDRELAEGYAKDELSESDRTQFEARLARGLCPNGGSPRLPQYSYRNRSPNPEWSGDHVVELIVLFFSDVVLDHQEAVLQKYSGGSHWRTLPDGWRALVPEKTIVDIAREDAVQWIQEGPPLPTDDNDDARGEEKGVNADALPAGLDGEGIVVAQMEGHTASPAHSDFGGSTGPRYTVADADVPIWTRSTLFLDDGVGTPGQFDPGERIYVDIDDNRLVSAPDRELTNCPDWFGCPVTDSLGATLHLFHPRVRYLETLEAGDPNHPTYSSSEEIFFDSDAAALGNGFSKIGFISDCDVTLSGGTKEGICCEEPCAANCVLDTGSVAKQTEKHEACDAPILSMPTNPHYHATHVGGTLIGNGAIDSQWKGIAPGARLLGYRVKTTYDLLSGGSTNGILGDYEHARAGGALISSNSWGYSYQFAYTCAAYTPNTAFYDSVTSGYTSTGDSFGSGTGMLVVASAGNAGKAFDVPWGTLRVPNSGKNTLVVGNLRASNAVNEHSSHGPTNDGRLKPDVAVLGTAIISPFPGNLYREESGTSMATPVVAGSAALVAQKYADVCGPEAASDSAVPATPSPAAMRALLIHSAIDVVSTATDAVEKEGPDFATGYGRVQVNKAVDLVADRDFLYRQIVETGDALTVEFEIDNTTADADLKVTLAWDDPPWTPNAAPNAVTGILQNDLDLLLEGPGGSEYRFFAPWVLDPANPEEPAASSRAATENEAIKRDHLNTVEQVLVPKEHVNPGTWRIRVTGFNLVHGPQTFVLVSEQISSRTSDQDSGSCQRPDAT